MSAFCVMLAALVAPMTSAASAAYQPAAENLKAREAFADLGFGVFLHWGLYALHGQGEWYQSVADVDRDEYAKLQGAFNPAAFNAQQSRCLCTDRRKGFARYDLCSEL